MLIRNSFYSIQNPGTDSYNIYFSVIDCHICQAMCCPPGPAAHEREVAEVLLEARVRPALVLPALHVQVHIILMS